MMTPDVGTTDTSNQPTSRSTLVTYTLTTLTSALDVSTLAAQLGQSHLATSSINPRSDEGNTRGVKQALQRCHRNLCCLKGFLRGLVERRSPVNHDISEDHPEDEDEDEEEEDVNNREMGNDSLTGMSIVDWSQHTLKPSHTNTRCHDLS